MAAVLDKEKYAGFDATRKMDGKPFHSLCYAPFNSLYFDFQGRVRVCCHNVFYYVGNVLENSIDEIWNGRKIGVLRQALKNYRFGPGCDFCHFQTADGNFANSAIRRFDWLDPESDSPRWPLQMEFSISNSCNLECVMCQGIYSSAIRARREKLPPLPKLYSEEFIGSLRKYLPHLKHVKFLGGEPFLVTEYFQIWDMLIDDELHTPCHVTTNGTQLNSKIERLLEKVPMSFSVSIDGASKPTVESIRVNANFEEVMSNARYFLEYSRERGTAFSLTFCLMRQNWQEFGDFCLLADEWDCPVYVNTVVDPPQFGIYTLGRDELLKVLEKLEAQAVDLDRLLKRNKSIWFGELDRIREKCANSAPSPYSGQTPQLLEV